MARLVVGRNQLFLLMSADANGRITAVPEAVTQKTYKSCVENRWVEFGPRDGVVITDAGKNVLKMAMHRRIQQFNSYCISKGKDPMEIKAELDNEFPQLAIAFRGGPLKSIETFKLV